MGEQNSRLSEAEARLGELKRRTGFLAWLWVSSTLDSVLQGVARGQGALLEGGRWILYSIYQVPRLFVSLVPDRLWLACAAVLCHTGRSVADSAQNFTNENRERELNRETEQVEKQQRTHKKRNRRKKKKSH